MMILAIKDVTETPRGPWGTIAILVAAGICWAITQADDWWKRFQEWRNPSPTETAAPLPLENRRSAPSRLTSHAGETGETGGTGHWAGRIVRGPDGVGRRIFTQVRHIAKTGESLPPGELVDEADPVPDDVVEADPEIDLALDGDDAELEANHEAAETLPELQTETAQQYIRRCLAVGTPKPVIIKGLGDYFGIPRATAYRKINAVAGAAPRRHVA